MAVLEGTFNTPVGTVPKKAAILVGGGILLLVGVMYYRGKKQDEAGQPSAAGASTEINPATGYVYGSPEDAAAMAAQGGYLTGGMVGGSGGGGGGSGGDPPVGTGFTNNAQWVQSTIIGMTNSGIIEDASALSVAIGKYIAGQPVGDNTTARSLIEQAIAFNGPPPLAGPNGYPPSINTQNPVGEPPPVTQPPPVTLPTTATAPANYDLYRWCGEQGVDFVRLFGMKKNDPNALNPSARNVMKWTGPAGSTLSPTFTTPQTLRIR
jgi:hypothetical protein